MPETDDGTRIPGDDGYTLAPEHLLWRRCAQTVHALWLEYAYLRMPRDGADLDTLEEQAQASLSQSTRQAIRNLDAGGAKAGRQALEAQRAELLAKVHGDERPLSALCISGGGIRSATFGLGAIQGLARSGLLDKFDYLSTVSGGGYIGSWLSAWICRTKEAEVARILQSEDRPQTDEDPRSVLCDLGRRSVIDELSRDRPAQAGAATGALDPVAHLRDYNNYLSPRLGVLSADTWTLGAIVVRNVLLNWLVLIPLMMGVLMLPRLFVALLAFPEIEFSDEIFGDGLHYDAPALDVISEHWAVATALPLLSVGSFAWALYNMFRQLPLGGGESAIDVGTGEFRVHVLIPLLVAVFTFLLYDALGYLGARYTEESSIVPVVLWSAIAFAGAWGAFILVGSKELLIKLTTDKRQARDASAAAGESPSLPQRVRKLLARARETLTLWKEWQVLRRRYNLASLHELYVSGVAKELSESADVSHPNAFLALLAGGLDVDLRQRLREVQAQFGFLDRIRRLLLLPPAILFMATGTGVAAWFATNFVLWSPDPELDLPWAVYATLAPPTILLGFVVSTMVFVGLTSRLLEDQDREWLSRAMAEVLLVIVVWLAVSAVVLIGPELALTWETWASGVMASIGAASAWVSAFGASFLAKRTRPGSGTKGKAAAGVELGLKFAPELFIALLAVGLAIVTNLLLVNVHALPGAQLLPDIAVMDPSGVPVPWNQHFHLVERSSIVLVVAITAVLFGVSLIAARYININTFSLHGMYRDRLVRAYLGASNSKTRANKFTGFADDDDLPMWRLTQFVEKPLHVVNLTLNILHPNRLAWQQRKAESFTVTGLHSGNDTLGYRPSRIYGGPDGISLGTAVATSGAAASPAMGYHSSPITGFVMTLFNARLGSWLGNPRTDRYKDPGPVSSVRWLVKEALGLASNDTDYVYLSDGGHFENLGVYEMVRRRCREIVVLDSGCDPEFSYEDLGNALRKIRIDMGITITFEDKLSRPLRLRKRRCAVAEIDYRSVDGESASNGWLIYIKPMLLGDEPPDVTTYACANPDFPHQTTNDQWFDESQTESYRMLGLRSVLEICDGLGADPTLEALKAHVEQSYLAVPAEELK